MKQFYIIKSYKWLVLQRINTTAGYYVSGHTDKAEAFKMADWLNEIGDE